MTSRKRYNVRLATCGECIKGFVIVEQGGAGDRAGTCAGAGTGTDAGQDANVSVRGLVEKGGQDSTFSGGWP